MKFPNVGTEARIVLDYLFQVKAASLDEIRIALTGKVSPSRVPIVLKSRRQNLQVESLDDKWSLTPKSIREIRKVHLPVLEIVPPRDAPIRRELNKSHYLNPLGSRPGSNDFRSVQSRY